MATSTPNEVQVRLTDYCSRHPDLSYKVIAEKLGVSVATVSRICIQNGLRRKRDILTEADLSKLEG